MSDPMPCRLAFQPNPIMSVKGREDYFLASIATAF
jgi:hypothetical protein